MKINALLMDPSDNVVTCVADVAAGEEIVWRDGEKILSLTAVSAIPFCHKAALADLKAGEEVVKYGESIGRLTADVPRGGLADHTNLVSVPRDYESEMVPETGGEEA